MTLLTYHSKYVVQSTTAVTTTSTSLQDDTQASQTFTLDSTKTVLVFYVANSSNGDTNSVVGFSNAINVDGSVYCQMYHSPNSSSAKRPTRNACFFVGQLSSGSHTIKGQFASNYASYAVTVTNRTLVIMILDGDEAWYTYNSTVLTSSSTSYIDDTYATITQTPSGNCNVLILYATTCLLGSTSSVDGAKICVKIGSTYQTESEASQSTGSSNWASSITTAYSISSLTAQTTFKGGFACNTSVTNPISKRAFAVLFFDPNVIIDTISSAERVTASSTSLIDDSETTSPAQATPISRTASGELLALAVASRKYAGSTSYSTYGMCYGLNIDGVDVALSRSSPNSGSRPESNFVAYAQTIQESKAWAVKGRISENYADASYDTSVSNRILIALWFPTGSPPTTLSCASSVAGSGSLSATATVIESSQTLSCASTISGSGNLSANNILYKLLSSILSASGSSSASNRVTAFITSTVSGSGSQTANNILLTFLQLASSLSGSGSSTANIIEFERLASSLSGSGSQTGNANLQKQIASTVSGSGSETANIIIFEVLNSSVAGSGSQTGNASLQKSINSSISGSGNETAAALVYDLISSTVTGIGSQTGNGILYQFLSSILSGSGDETANIAVINYGDGVECSSVISGSGSQSASSLVYDYVSSDISGSGNETANAKLNKMLGSILSGSGSQSSTVIVYDFVSSSVSSYGNLTANAALKKQLSSILSGSGSQNSSAVVSAYLSSSISGSGSQTANDILYKFISSIISGSGDTTSNVIILNYGSGVECYSSIAGSGPQSANSILYNYLNSSVSGSGSETGNANLQKSVTSNINGSGSQTSVVSLQKIIQSFIEASGSSSATLILYSQLSSVLEGSGEATATHTLYNYISSNVAGSGNATANLSLNEIISSILEGTGDSSSYAIVIEVEPPTSSDLKYPLRISVSVHRKTISGSTHRRTVS